MTVDATCFTEHSGANMSTCFTDISFYIGSFEERQTEPCTDRQSCRGSNVQAYVCSRTCGHRPFTHLHISSGEAPLTVPMCSKLAPRRPPGHLAFN
jgi:hypothetical protein